MITLHFNQKTDFDTSLLPERWRERVTVLRHVATGENRVSIDIDVEDSSYRYRALMQRPLLSLKFSLPYFVEFPVGTTCVFQNQTYTLNDPENIKKQSGKNIEYTMLLGTPEDHLSLYKLRNSVDGRLKWSMCAKPHEFIEEICKALNARDGAGVWYCDKAHIIEATEKTIEFNHTYCDAALSSVAETFETEYEIIDRNTGRFEIALHKVEYFKEDPLPLSYGKGNGFVPGLGRATEADGKPVKRLYVQGGDQNIDRSEYGKLFNYSNNPAELRLPKSQKIEYEGRTYQSDPEGYYIERVDKVSTAVKEDSLDCSEIYPSYVGTVSKVENPKPEKNWWDIIDNGIPSALNFNNYIIAGESMTIIFQSGMLASREFEVKYKHDERRWELVPIEQDGVNMPDNTFKPVEGDTYAVFGIMLPKEYICDNDSKTGAAWDMMKEAARYMYEHEEQKFTFSGELQALYAKRNWLKIGGYLKVGSYIRFEDNQFAPEGTDIRIIGIKDYVNSPYSPTLEISNAIQSPTTASSQLNQIDNQEVALDDTKKSLIQFTKRRFRDAKETIEMLEDSLLQGFTNSISPIAVQAMSMLIGDESLQFRFVGRSGGELVSRACPLSYNQNTKKLEGSMNSGGMEIQLQHLTIGQTTITTEAGRQKANYLTWPLKDYESPTLANPETRYYVYCKVHRTNTTLKGEFELSEAAIPMEKEANYYYLLVGILNSEIDGERSFVTLYGFTEILPGRITTDRLVSTDGESFLDLESGALKLGDCLDYNVSGDKALHLKFLLSENANLGGWIFRNNRLESQDGAVWLDGIKGDVNLSGILRLSTTTIGESQVANNNVKSAHIVTLQPMNKTISISLNIGAEQVGKVYRIYNSNPLNSYTHTVHGARFTYGENYAAEWEGQNWSIKPQEIIEVTCFKTADNEAQWVLTGRFSFQDFKSDGAVGRYPLMLALGRITYNSGNLSLSGNLYNGKSISSNAQVESQGTGLYKVTFNSGAIPGGFKVFVTGYGSRYVDARIQEVTSTSFTVSLSDDDSANDGSCEFMILSTGGWFYNT